MSSNLPKSNSSIRANIIVGYLLCWRAIDFEIAIEESIPFSCHIMDWFYWIGHCHKKVHSHMCAHNFTFTYWWNFTSIFSHCLAIYPEVTNRSKKDFLTLSPVENYSGHRIVIYSTERYLRLMCRLGDIQFNSILIAYKRLLFKCILFAFKPLSSHSMHRPRLE